MQLRKERYGVVQLLEHYVYLTEVTVNYAVQAAYVHPEDIGADVVMFNITKTE